MLINGRVLERCALEKEDCLCTYYPWEQGAEYINSLDIQSKPIYNHLVFNTATASIDVSIPKFVAPTAINTRMNVCQLVHCG